MSLREECATGALLDTSDTAAERTGHSKSAREVSDDRGETVRHRNLAELRELIEGEPIKFIDAIEKKDILKYYYMRPDVVLELSRYHRSLDLSQTQPVEVRFFSLDGNCIRADAKRYEPASVFLLQYELPVARADVWSLSGRPSFLKEPNLPRLNVTPPLHRTFEYL